MKCTVGISIHGTAPVRWSHIRTVVVVVVLVILVVQGHLDAAQLV